MALSASRNAGAKFSEAGYIRLVKRSEGDDEFALSVGSRSEIPRHHFLKLLTKASQAIRHKLETAHPQNVHDIKHVAKLRRRSRPRPLPRREVSRRAHW